jgi:hypothetical protein
MSITTVHINPIPRHGKIVLDLPGIKCCDGYKFMPGTYITFSAAPDREYEFDV